MVLCIGKRGRGGGTTSSGQWHLGKTGGLSSFFKICFLLHPKDLVLQHQAPTGFGHFCLVSGERWVHCRSLPGGWNTGGGGEMAEHCSALRGVNGCWWRTLLCCRLKPGPGIPPLHWVLLIWQSLLYSNGIALNWHQEWKSILLNRNVSIPNYKWILVTSPLYYFGHAMFSFISMPVWEENLVDHCL